MAIEVADALKNANLDYGLRGIEPAAVTLVELALCTDGAFTEATAVTYDRADLTANLAAAAAGEIVDSFSFDVGADIVTHFMILHDGVWKVRGALQSQKTGAFSLSFRSLLRGVAA